VNAILSAAPERLRAAGVGAAAAGPGERAPDFALPNVRGETVRLGDLLGRGPVVLAFYRGVW
jgi:peroxiredoxin